MNTDLYQSLLRYRTAYDELSADGVNPRPHWAEVMESLRAIGNEELGRRWSRAERRIRENGTTYNVYSDPLGVSRPWSIDIVPLLIPADEWRFIEEAAGTVTRHPDLKQLFDGGDHEVSIFWVNDLGIHCKCRLEDRKSVV